jgi:hypothetical protein
MSHLRHPLPRPHALTVAIATALTLCASVPAEAQFGRLKDRIKQKVEQKVDEKVDKKVDAALGDKQDAAAQPETAQEGASDASTAPTSRK